ncbi:hypothetical protein GH714_008698 [Hevea brasiliensis]|uniref:Uncharacterized protein n=1 Tax=Hevea brasiliensis TaxID=3981 RepID=A0A6A6MLF8_HEVBR|nr:hypothetical protein GH714_008698 [Hevea brasiliensis]
MATQHENYVPIVTVTKRASVYPKTVHPHRILNLSSLDRQCPLLMYLVFFYKPSHAYDNLSLNLVFSSLKSGLEETLSIWYPAAGRLNLNPNDGKLNLWCNNEGAVLSEAVTQVKISDLGDLSQYNEFFENLVYKPVFNGNFSEMPLVVAQVTKFGCGGYSVGVGASHSLFDGPATFNFLCAWACNSATMKEKGSLNKSRRTGSRSHEAIIEKIKQAKNSVNSDYVKAYMEALDGPQANLPPLNELTLVSDWTRMPFHKVNFLQGDAAYACPLVSPFPLLTLCRIQSTSEAIVSKAVQLGGLEEIDRKFKNSQADSVFMKEQDKSLQRKWNDVQRIWTLYILWISHSPPEQ